LLGVGARRRRTQLQQIPPLPIKTDYFLVFQSYLEMEAEEEITGK
jgi:hypothetical protein